MRIILSSAIRKDQYAMSQYRWVMAAIAGLLMTTSFISLTSFGILSGRMASTFGVSPVVLSVLGIDAFSIGLFAAETWNEAGGVLVATK